MSTTIKEALAKLDPANANHWTQAGEPRMEYLRIVAGNSSLTKEQVQSEVPGFNREEAAKQAEQAQQDAPKDGEGVGTGNAAQDQGATTTQGTPEQAAQTPAPSTQGAGQDQGTPEQPATPASKSQEEIDSDARATAARNLVVSQMPVQLGLPSRAEELVNTTKDAFEIAGDLAGKEVSGGSFTGKGDQGDVIKDIDDNDYSDEAFEQAGLNLEEARRQLAGKQMQLNEVQAEYDRIQAYRHAQAESGDDAGLSYKEAMQREAQNKADRARTFGEAFAAVSSQMPQLSAADKAIAANNLARRKAGQ